MSILSRMGKHISKSQTGHICVPTSRPKDKGTVEEGVDVIADAVAPDEKGPGADTFTSLLCPRMGESWSCPRVGITTQCQDEFRIPSGRTQKLKVAKWCWKQQNEHNLIYIYHKQCENMQKIQWKCSNGQIQCFYKGTSGALCWKPKKTRKTRETKTRIAQNFLIVWPIPGCTMSKSMPRAFRKCGTFRYLKVFNQSYWLSKSGQIWRKKFSEWRRHKKKTRLQYCTEGRHMNRIGFSHGKFDVLFISGLKTAYWSRVFFLTPTIFEDKLKISDSVDFDQP